MDAALLIMLPMSAASQTRSIILFDGDCAYCSRWVLWILRRDRHAQFRFAASRSEAAREVLTRCGWSGPPPESVVLVADQKVVTNSDAVIGIACRLGWPWKAAAIARLIPRPLRDALYRRVAANRHRLGGSATACLVPTPETRARFLDLDAAPGP